MLTRRSLIVGACACAGCATIPQADPISDDEYDLFNLLWRDLDCRESNGLDLIVTSTRTIKPRALMDDNSIVDRGVKFIIEKHKDKLTLDAVDNFFSANERSFEINPARIETKCARFAAPEEARTIARTFNAGEIYRQEREETQRRIREYRERGGAASLTEEQRLRSEELARVMAEARERGEDPVKTYREFTQNTEPSVPYPTRRAVSRFGFDKARRLAIGVTDDYCGPLCAVMELVIANRTDAGWVITEKDWFYIS